MSTTRGGLDELDRRPARYHLFARVGSGALGCLHRRLVATKAVVQHRIRPFGKGDPGAFASAVYVPDGGVDERGRLGLSTAKRRQA